MKLDNNDLLLYAITDRTWLNGVSLLSQVDKAIAGGASIIQLREKNLDNQTFTKEAKQIQKLCKKNNIPFIINDNVEIAIKINSDGIHVGQNDMEAYDVRNIIGQNKILGVSVQTVKQAIFAEKCGADYLGVGAIFPTNTKNDANEVDICTLKSICKNVNIPVVAIGGITLNNLDQLKNSGICGVAVISAIFAQKNIFKETKKLKMRVTNIIKGG